jgi:hypothetical protein
MRRRHPAGIVPALAFAACAIVACGQSSLSTPGKGDAHDLDVATELPPAPDADDAADAEDARPDEEGDAAIDAEPPDAATDEASADTDAAVDETAPDAAGDADDVSPDLPPECTATEPFDYTCKTNDPGTCPGGLCLFGLCIAPVLDPARWGTCGSGICDPCETATGCPADCATPPVIAGPKSYDGADTITVWAHGFWNKSADEMKAEVYGKDRGCGDVYDFAKAFGIDRPCGNTPANETSPVQFAAVEYYGGTPPAWMTPAEVAEIEQYPYDGALALERYARVYAKWIRHKLTISGAKFVNLSCHSMGCLITRTMIERDFENLATEGRFVRWSTSAGVIAGARLARLYDNPTVQQAADAIGLLLSDFVVMNPDFVRDNVAVWDHQLWQGNSPLLGGMIIHHLGGTDPFIEEALNIPLLDLNNPGDLPNDGIMYTEDEYFHGQDAAVAFHTPAGDVLPSTHSFVREYHMQVPDTDAMGVLSVAGLFHHRKVRITLDEVEMKDDREADGLFDFSEHGTPPAEVVAEVEVRYPWASQVLGRDVLVHEAKMDHRSVDMFVQEQGTFAHPGTVLFEGPVFDEMDSLKLKVDVLEADWYPRFDVQEWIADKDQELASFNGTVAFSDEWVVFETGYARVRLKVQVFTLY